MDFRAGQAQLELTGAWSFAYSLSPPVEEFRSLSDLDAAGLKLHPCAVPGNFELDLQAFGIIEDPFYGSNITSLRAFEQAHVWYARRFEANPPPDCDPVLVFEGLDCYADIYLNGELLGSTDNMLVEHVLPVTGLLREQNELVVHFRPTVVEAAKHDYPALVAAMEQNYESLYVRKAPHMFGWDIAPRAVSAGIWRPVRLRFLPRERLERVYLDTTRLTEDHAEAQLDCRYQAHVPTWGADRYELRLSGEGEGSVFTHLQRLSFSAGQFGIAVTDPKLWWPKGRGEQHLYSIRATLLKNGVEIDSLSFTHGLRTVALERTSTTGPGGEGEFCFRVNGERIFVKGTNWVPADAFHSRDRARLPRMLELADDLGCNMIRCWGGNVYEDDLFYDTCDRKGLLVWQDFAMACAIYPQDDAFCARLAEEARKVVRRLRQHPCLVLWAGDNECDLGWQAWFGQPLDPNRNRLTREVLPRVCQEEDPGRPYLPSSPYVDAAARGVEERYLPEQHLWGPRDYFKSPFYKESLCHFASEIGYHGCPSPDSIREFISPEMLWPYQNNEEWLVHAVAPYTYRIELMAKQIREFFGTVPDNLDDFAFASQACQAEAKKFFIELFRGQKWRRTGLLWWNLIDGWPQFSDAVVDYYFREKLAYQFIKASQQPVLLLLREPENWGQDIVVSNDTRKAVELTYSVRDLDTAHTVSEGKGIAAPDRVTVLGRIPFSLGEQHLYLLEWQTEAGVARNHYLAGNPPFALDRYRRWLSRAGLLGPWASSAESGKELAANAD